MPELPEVETIRRDLAPLVTGRRIGRVTVAPATAPLLLGGVDAATFAGQLVGRTITDAGRRGKYLLFALDDGMTWVVHLRMTGRLVWHEAAAPNEPIERFERARVELSGGHELRWCDVRKFGTWLLTPDVTAYLAAKLGPEPIDPAFTVAQFRRALAGRAAPVKSVLLDQRRVAGLGNIYVDEALYQAGVNPSQTAGGLGPAATQRLFVAAREVLERAIANRGASFKDYVDGMGNQGTQHMFVQVFRRTGQPCYACGTVIERTVIGGRATHFCPRCQKLSKSRQPRHDSHRA